MAPPVAQQNVQVTETPVATSDFVLPPVTERPLEFAQPQIKPLEVSVPTREVTVAVAPPVQRPLPQREIAVPQVSSAIPEVRQREIATPLPQVRNVQVPTRDLPTPSLRAATPGAVSYTHLDVYKRQGQHSGRTGGVVCGALAFVDTIVVRANEQQRCCLLYTSRCV